MNVEALLKEFDNNDDRSVFEMLARAFHKHISIYDTIAILAKHLKALRSIAKITLQSN